MGGLGRTSLSIFDDRGFGEVATHFPKDVCDRWILLPIGRSDLVEEIVFGGYKEAN